ncbi:MAG: GHKL domain-containing protein, partial [Bacteroidia bacterium]|nr:GHKL domain-containing protein [Bacteroidia bacterium]
SVSTNPVFSENGKYKGALAMITDITQRKLHEEQLKKSEADLELKNKELEQKNKELEQFAYVASHDLQEPLRTTSSFAELLQQQYKGKLDEKADKYLTFINQSSDRMKILIKDLLDYSRIGRKKELEQVDCNIILEEVLADIDVAIKETQTEIKFSRLPVIKGNPTEIKQLFQNLIINAIKFRRQDESPRINISAKRKDKHWEFSCSDNGIGISEDHRERIFIIFQRLHTRNEYEGSGIGLSHCKKIVELHKGKLWVDSTLGEGSTFYFTIPENNNL